MVRAYLDASRLGKGFKAAICKELENIGTKVELMPLVRQYVGSLGNSHERVRALLSNNISQWDTSVLRAIERFENDHSGEKSLGLMVVRVAEDGTQERGAWVLSSPIEYRRELEGKRRDIGTLARRYVSSESGSEPSRACSGFPRNCLEKNFQESEKGVYRNFPKLALAPSNPLSDCTGGGMPPKSLAARPPPPTEF